MRDYTILFIDDEPEIIKPIAERAKTNLEKQGINVCYQILSKASEIEKMNDMAADVLLFDCQFSGSDIISEGNNFSQFGFELIKRFRQKNKGTRIIFYSGGFTLDDSECYDFTEAEILQLINELHIFKMIPKDESIISNSIIDAITDLDSVIMSLEDMKKDYNDISYFVVEGKKYSIDALLNELKNGTETGESFRKNVNEMILAYLMKFTGEE